MVYRKRRIIKGPNKNEEKLLRQQNNLSPLKEYFSDVSHLTLDLTFSSEEGQLLQEDHLTYGPDDSVNFIISCPGGCGDGKTNLQGKIESTVRQRLDSGEGRAQCANPLYSGVKLCGCEVKCQIRVDYFPDQEEEA